MTWRRPPAGFASPGETQWSWSANLGPVQKFWEQLVYRRSLTTYRSTAVRWQFTFFCPPKVLWNDLSTFDRYNGAEKFKGEVLPVNWSIQENYFRVTAVIFFKNGCRQHKCSQWPLSIRKPSKNYFTEVNNVSVLCQQFIHRNGRSLDVPLNRTPWQWGGNSDPDVQYPVERPGSRRKLSLTRNLGPLFFFLGRLSNILCTSVHYFVASVPVPSRTVISCDRWVTLLHWSFMFMSHRQFSAYFFGGLLFPRALLCESLFVEVRKFHQWESFVEMRGLSIPTLASVCGCIAAINIISSYHEIINIRIVP